MEFHTIDKHVLVYGTLKVIKIFHIFLDIYVNTDYFVTTAYHVVTVDFTVMFE